MLSSKSKKIKVGNKDAVEITGKSLDYVFVSIDSTSTLVISNDRGSIDSKTFASVISSFTFNNTSSSPNQETPHIDSVTPQSAEIGKTI